MKCYICDSDEQFHSLKDIHPERELMVCKPCGNICYRVEPKNEEQVKEYYRKEYRAIPSHLNLLTTQNKLNYIRVFLGDYLKDKKNLICGDVGCATGYVPNWLRGLGHRATGCEYTISYRRFAEHFYGFPVTEELPTKYKYDLISIYHVLEHIVEPDKKLKHYADLLADDGRMLIATPTWLDILEEASGAPMATFENLFHKDHINVFTINSVQRLFAKCGLVVEKEDHIQYGQTYLLKKAKTVQEIKAPEPEKWETQAALILKCKEAIELYKKRMFKEATEVWPKFPEAWLKLIFDVHGKSPDHQIDLWESAKPHLVDSWRMRYGLGMWFYQKDEIDKAIECFEWFIQSKPNSEAYMQLGYCFAKKDMHQKAIRAFNMSAQVNPLQWSNAMNWACRSAAQIPTWDERAMIDLKDKFVKDNFAKIKMEPKDERFETNGNTQQPSQTKEPATGEHA